MNGEGVLTAAVCFLCIGVFHPIVIRAEYRWSARCWPWFLAAGSLFLAGSLMVQATLGSAVLGVLGCSCLWSIRELHQQAERVRKGWFPENPNRRKRDGGRRENDDLDH